jgi:glutathione-regulated potassium-efflux system ancillary protein KefG
MPDAPRIIQLIIAHPHLAASRINAALLRGAATVAGVEVHDLYHHAPDGWFDVRAEQARLLRADAVVLQFPLHWYSVTPLLKAWMDEVLLAGWAYGRDGTALRGKGLLVATTCGGDPDDYGRHAGQFTLTELLRPLEATARYCGMHYLGHVAYGANENVNDHLAGWASDYANRLSQIVQAPWPPAADSR